MSKEEIIKTQKELIDLLYSQVQDLSLMSKIELGDDAIDEVNRLNKLLNNQPVVEDNKEHKTLPPLPSPPLSRFLKEGKEPSKPKNFPF